MRTLLVGLVVPLVLALGVVGLGAPDPAPDSGSSAAHTFREAELAERAFGDLERAGRLYLESAAAATDAAGRVRAQLRAASCLRRAGSQDAARAVIDELAALPVEEVPADLRAALRAEQQALGAVVPQNGNEGSEVAGGSSSIDERLAQAERDKAELQRRLEDLLLRQEQKEGELAEELGRRRSLQTEIEQLRAERSAAEPQSAQDVLNVRLRERREAAREGVRLARLLIDAAQYAYARDTLHDALGHDPDNAEARALLDRVSAPLGGRQRLHQSILETEALMHEVRLARLAAEVERLVDEGARRQRVGDMQGSTEPLVRARAYLDIAADALWLPNSVRRDIDDMLAAAEAAGATRPEPPVVETPEWKPSWTTAIHELMERDGREVAHGLSLVFHDLDALLQRGGAGLPPRPVGMAPRGWTLSGAQVDAGPLLVGYLASTEAPALRTPGASMRRVGTSAVTLASREAQLRLTDRITEIVSAQGPSSSLRVRAASATPGDWAALLARNGLVAETVGNNARVVRLTAKAAQVLTRELASRPDAVIGDAGFEQPPLHAFRLAAGTLLSPLTVDVVPVPGPHAGVGLRVHVAHRPAARSGDAPLEQEVLAGSVLERGEALMVFGLALPQDPQRDLAIIVQSGEAPTRRPTNVVEGPKTDAPLPPATDGMRSAAHLLPRWLARLHEVGSLPLHSPDLPVLGRSEALLARLERVAEGAFLLELQGDRVTLVGPESAHEGVRKLLAQLEARRAPQLFDVQVYEVSYERQDRVRRLVSTLASTRDGAFHWGIVRGPAAQKQVELLLEAGKGGRMTLLSPRASAPATGRADVARVERTVYRRDLDLASGPEWGWGRSETAWLDLGLLLSFRPFGLTDTRRVDFDLSVRTALLVDRGAVVRPTAFGQVELLAPEVRASGGDISLTLAPDELLLLSALANPFTSGPERESLVVLVRAPE